jgi:hypothetical protein
MRRTVCPIVLLLAALLGLNFAAAADEDEPPVVRIKKVKEIKDGDKSKIRIVAEAVPAPKGQPVESLRVLIDGRPYTKAEPKKFKPDQPAVTEWVIDQIPGRHELIVLARCKDVAGISEKVVLKAPVPDKDRPVLYRVCVGINDYDQKGLRLSTAAQDAEALFDGLDKYCTGKDNQYRAGLGQKILDRAATRQAVLDALKGVQKQAKPTDLLVVVFVGCSGVQAGNFYLLTREADPTKPLEGNSLSGDDLSRELGEVPCGVLLLADCHAEPGVRAAKFRAAADAFTRALTDEQVGVTVLAAGMHYQTVREGKEHGLFTQALLKGLATADGAGAERLLDVPHLFDHVFKEVRAASAGAQSPFLSMPANVPPLVLRQVPEKPSKK